MMIPAKGPNAMRMLERSAAVSLLVFFSMTIVQPSTITTTFPPIHPTTRLSQSPGLTLRFEQAENVVLLDCGIWSVFLVQSGFPYS